MQNLTSRSFGLRSFCNQTLIRRYLQKLVSHNLSNNDDDCLDVSWLDGSVEKFPYLFLRENCRCPECFHPHQKERKINAPKVINLDIEPETVCLNGDGDQLNVKWNDGHSSVYSSEFLKGLRYRKPGEGQPPGVLRNKVEVWGSKYFEDGKLQTFDFVELLKDDHELYKWLDVLATRTGIAKIKNIPTERGQLKLLGDRVGYLMATFYGLVTLVYSRVYSKLNATVYFHKYRTKHISKNYDILKLNISS